MRTKALPRSDLRVSVIGLGTLYLGSTVHWQTSKQILDRYVEAGGNFIDTAEVYAGWIPGGEHQSEEVIGRWLRERGDRDQIVLSTKGSSPKLESMHIPRLSKQEIKKNPI